MSRIVASSVVILSLLAAAPDRAGAEEVRLPSPRSEWRSLSTPNFRIVGEASARKLRELGEELELFRASLLWLTPGASASSPVPTTVLAFANQRTFGPYGDVGFEDDNPRIGVFHTTSWGNYILVDASADNEERLSTVHEGYVWFFVHSNYPSTPLWLVAGLREYFGNFHAGRNGIEVGRPSRQHLSELRSGWRMPLARLVEVGRSDPEYRDESTSRVFRAQCWLLVHYALIGEPAMAPRLVEFLRRVDAGQPPAEALPVAFGMSLAELEQRLHAYAGQSIFKYRSYDAAELRPPELGEPIEIPRAEALVVLGEFLAHADAVDAARAHLDAALELDPSNGDAVALQGYLAEQAKDPARADALYLRAAGLQMRRATSAAHAARFALGRAKLEERGSEPERALLDRARGLTDRAIELDPDYGEPWALRGMGELRAGDADAAVVTLAEACRRLPDRADVLYNRFLANLEAGQLVVARGIATGSLQRLDPESAAIARQQLEWQNDERSIQAAMEESRRQVDSGELDAAAARLREELANVDDPQQREYLERQIASLEVFIAEQSRVNAYNRSVDLANSGKYEEAKAELERMLVDCGDAEVCDAARNMLGRLQELLRRRN